MKKINLLLIASVMMTGLGTMQSCQTSGKTSSSSKLLKFNFQNGKGYDYEMTTSMDEDIMGKPMKMDMSAYYSMDVTGDSADTKTITTSIDRFKMKMDVAGMNLDVDTDKPSTGGDSDNEKNPMNMLNRVFGAIKGQRFSMQVDAEGKVLKVTGFENMAQMLVDSMGLDEEHRQEVIQKFDQQFNGNKMKEQFERMWYIFPNKEVKVGDTWQKNSELGGGMGGAKYNSTYKVKEIEGDMVTLDETTKIVSDSEQAKVDGDVTGTLVIDSRTGLVVSADQDMTIKTSAAGMSFEIKAKTKVKGKAR